MIVLLLAACRCNSNRVGQPPDVPPGGSFVDAPADQAPPGIDQAAYSRMDEAAQACAILGYLKCPEADDQDKCSADVRKLIEIGTFEHTDVTCIRQSRTVEHVRACQVQCGPWPSTSASGAPAPSLSR